MLTKISPRLKIKSSLPKHLEALFSSYILWKIHGKPKKLDYGELSSDDDGELRFTVEELNSLNSYFDCNDISLESSKDNPLLTAQIEHLQVGCLNIYKACYFKFQDDSRADSSERSGGVRFLKSIIFTSVMDLIDGIVGSCEDSFKTFIKPAFTDDTFDKRLISSQLKALITFLIEQCRFIDENKGTHDLITDITNGHRFYKDGPARILKAIVKDGVNEHIELDGNSYKARNAEEYEGYESRVKLFSQIFSPNYSVEEETVSYDDSLNASDTHIDIPDKIPLNLLFKGVPGTGKSWTIDEILSTHFKSATTITDSQGKRLARIKRINLHSGSTNSSLMQGVSVSAKDGNVVYDEKVGIILDFVLTSIKYPSIPFAIVLEEIQENSLNDLIGDLIYLIEPSKRVEGYKIDLEKDVFEEIERITNENDGVHYVTMPSLINGDSVEKRLFLPSNLYFFCTSNYREDKKVIEDNLLRRFDVIELYPNYNEIKDNNVSEFLKSFNNLITEEVNDIHSDRYIIGHANWMYVDDKYKFSQAFLKLLVEFKDIREVDFDTLINVINSSKVPFEFNFKDFKDYKSLINFVQPNCGYSFLYGE